MKERIIFIVFMVLILFIIGLTMALTVVKSVENTPDFVSDLITENNINFVKVSVKHIENPITVSQAVSSAERYRVSRVEVIE